MTGRINTQYNKVEDYFTLKEENRRIHRLNDSLLNLLPNNYAKRDTSLRIIRDSVPYDTSGLYRRYFLRPATVVYNTVNSQKNYIQINRGANQGIKDGQAVINSDGNAIGVVVNVSPNFSQVMSFLHVQSKVSVSLKKTGESGTLEWDGKSPDQLILNRMPKTVTIVIGDTIITSGYSQLNFPKGFMVGTVSSVKLDGESGLYSLKLKPAANFYSLQQVHVIENMEVNEQLKLLEETKRKVEEVKKAPK
jgi:rod shape-determining protein MreC